MVGGMVVVDVGVEVVRRVIAVVAKFDVDADNVNEGSMDDPDGVSVVLPVDANEVEFELEVVVDMVVSVVSA